MANGINAGARKKKSKTTKEQTNVNEEQDTRNNTLHESGGNSNGDNDDANGGNENNNSTNSNASVEDEGDLNEESGGNSNGDNDDANGGNENNNSRANPFLNRLFGTDESSEEENEKPYNSDESVSSDEEESAVVIPSLLGGEFDSTALTNLIIRIIEFREKYNQRKKKSHTTIASVMICLAEVVTFSRDKNKNRLRFECLSDIAQQHKLLAIQSDGRSYMKRRMRYYNSISVHLKEYTDSLNLREFTKVHQKLGGIKKNVKNNEEYSYTNLYMLELFKEIGL